MLTIRQQAEILSLHFGKGHSIRRIARDLKVNRKSVMRTLKRRSILEKRPKSSSARPSIVDQFRPHIIELLRIDPNIPSSTVLQRIRAKGFLGGKSNFNRIIRSLRTISSGTREAFHSITFAPGECAQVDWGEFGDVFGDGIKIHCFILVLCYSRLLYVEFTRGEKFEDFIRCHQNAFKFFCQRVPRECWYDNLTSAVTERMNSLVKFNSRFLAYMGHHSIRPHACNPARGNEKGRVEDGVKFVKSSFWPGRKFLNFDDLCVQAIDWRDQFANRREHRATLKIPILHFDQEEKNALLSINPHPYDTDEMFSRVVPPNFMIPYDTNRYSVPWTLVGMPVTVRVDDRSIRFYYNEKLVAGHERSYKKHGQFCKDEHSSGLFERKPGASKAGQQIAQVRQLGSAVAKYLDFIKSGDRSLKSEAAHLLAFATIYGEELLNKACEELLKMGVIGTANLELLLKTMTSPENKKPNPLVFEKNQLNRLVPTIDLRRYDRLLFESGDKHDELPIKGNPHETGNDNGTPDGISR